MHPYLAPLALLLLTVIAPACAAWQKCTAPQLESPQATELRPQVLTAVSGERWDGGAALDVLVRGFGPLVVCLVRELALGFIQPHEAVGIDEQQQERTTRARLWLLSRGHKP